jgi:NAD(P)-dependent dehydrogenase (short-subunit alcohol dehydrogenase family)
MQLAVVTGAAEGIGLGIARRLAADGYRVVLADRQLERAQAEAQGLPHGAAALPLDVADEASWASFAEAMAELGPPDVLVNNAGVNPGAIRFEELPLETWRRVMAVNLDGVFLGCRWALRAMAGRGGAIVNIGSAAGRKPAPDLAPYSASKAAVEMLTRTVALYGGREKLGVRCNAVLPGTIETPMVDRLREATGDPAAARARVAALHPIGFVGAPEDIAGAVAWLASPEARFVTGAVLAVDGGLSI